MSIIAQEKARRGATSDDCGRLWSHLTSEYIPELKILLNIRQDSVGKGYLTMSLESAGYDAKTGKPCVDVWANSTFFNELNLISSERLFDLLIIGHRRIEDYFAFGESCAPVRREA